jgi:hypothetical protein
LKPLSASQRSVGAFLLACAAAACVLRCSGSNENYGAPFAGTWSCPASLSAISPTLTITQNLDDSLTLSAGADSGGGTFCATDLWTYSGSTASMKAGTSCTGPGGEVIVVNTFKMTASGNTLSVSANETVTGQATEADGGAVGPLTKTTLNVSGSCTKQ